MAEQYGEKTEAPTPKRRQKAVEQGDLLKSKDFGAALVVLLGAGWIMLLGPALVDACKAVMIASFRFGRDEVVAFEPWRLLGQAGVTLAPSMGALLAITFLGAILSQAGLGALQFNGKLFQPKASRINPAAGLKRMFGANGWIELGKSLLKVVLLGAIGGWLMWQMTSDSFGLIATDLNRATDALGGIFLGLFLAMAAGLVIIAGVDLPIQIIQHLNRIKMTKQEVRDEHKETEGSPEAKAHQRARQRELARGGNRKALATAHVVLTNPTHFAVALRYEQGKDQVPVVVARGRGETALAIRELAAEFAVPMLEVPALARAVYFTSRVNQEIRDDLYLAVATVLAFVFGLNRMAGGRMPEIDVPATARFDENGVTERAGG